MSSRSTAGRLRSVRLEHQHRVPAKLRGVVSRKRPGVRKWGLLGLKAARGASELATAAAELTSRAGFGLGESLASYAGVAAERAAVHLDGTGAKWLSPVLTSVVVPAAATAGAALASAKDFTAAGLDLSRQTVEFGIAGAERLLADSAQFALLSSALPKVAAMVRQFARDMPDASAPALLQALYALSCIQASSGPIAPPARAVCDTCALLEQPPPFSPALQPEEAAELRSMVRYAVGAYGGAALAVLRGACPVMDIAARLRCLPAHALSCSLFRTRYICGDARRQPCRHGCSPGHPRL